MEELWKAGEASVRDVLEVINGREPRQRAYTTIMTTLQRLERKGLIEHRQEGKSHIYRPVFTEVEYAEARAGVEVDALVDEFGDVALVHFAKQMSKLDRDRREKLRRLARG